MTLTMHSTQRQRKTSLEKFIISTANTANDELPIRKQCVRFDNCACDLLQTLLDIINKGCSHIDAAHTESFFYSSLPLRKLSGFQLVYDRGSFDLS